MLLRSVFLKTLRDHRRSFIWWGAGLALLTAVITAIYPSIQGMGENLQALMDAYPPELMALLGATDIVDITSPAGYLNAELFGFMVPILFIVFSVALGGSAVAGEEGRGTLETLMSAPITRARLVVNKLAALVAETVILGLILWAALVVGTIAVDMDISVIRLAEATISAVLLGLTFGTAAFAVGCATGSRGLSVGVATVAAVGTYMFNALSIIVDYMEPTKWASPFFYYNGATPLANGLNLAHASVLLATVLVLGAVAYFTFERRDLGVG